MVGGRIAGGALQRYLDADDIDEVERTISDAIAERLPEHGQAQAPYAFDPGVLEFIASQALLPILVSLTADGLKRVLKGHKIGQVSKRDARNIANDLIGHQVSTAGSLTPEAFEALAEQLRPLGMSDAKILEVFDNARDRLAARES
jgi:hypothetical protein